VCSSDASSSSSSGWKESVSSYRALFSPSGSTEENEGGRDEMGVLTCAEDDEESSVRGTSSIAESFTLVFVWKCVPVHSDSLRQPRSSNRIRREDERDDGRDKESRCRVGRGERGSDAAYI
jgi:hypothetical protein